MRINIASRHMNVSDSLRKMVERKLGKLDKYFDLDTVAEVHISKQKLREIMEVTILFDGVILRAEEATDDIYTSIDRVVRKLERQIRHHRSRLEKRLRTGAFHGDAPDDAADDEAANLEIVRYKKFKIKPLDIEEAMMQMELLHHDFFVFRNAETNEVNVLYKRKDGNLGLIEPEY